MSTGEAVEGRKLGGDVSSFRFAVERARGETRGSGPVAALARRDVGRRFEVRREKRRGKKDVVRWNELGQSGWELVAVVGKHAYFRRELLAD